MRPTCKPCCERLQTTIPAPPRQDTPATTNTATNDGYAVLARLLNGETDASRVIEALEASGLRGLGGAGFPAGQKWRILREQSAPRYLAVNIDEGEPGTFKDRHYLERDPHRLLEGALIAAVTVGIEAIYFYLRDEYAGIYRMLQTELAKLENDPPMKLPRIELRRGAGAYICGEESAMIESIEGKRGMPRLRPPFVAQVGLFGRPTLEHNMETLYWIRDILEQGADRFASSGRNGRTGLRSFSVSGRVNRPGVHLAPAGITARELIDEYCGGMLDGHRLYGYFPGGASGGILPAAMADIPLDFDTLDEHGCFYRFGRDHRALRSRPGTRRRPQRDAVFLARILRQMHPLPGRHRQGRALDETAALGHRVDERFVSNHVRRLDLRTRAGGVEPVAMRHPVLPERAGSRPPNGVGQRMNHRHEHATESVAFTLDGAPLNARKNETILNAAQRHGHSIPHLCYKQGLRPDGNCRVCMVQIEGERTPAAGVHA